MNTCIRYGWMDGIDSFFVGEDDAANSLPLVGIVHPLLSGAYWFATNEKHLLGLFRST